MNLCSPGILTSAVLLLAGLRPVTAAVMLFDFGNGVPFTTTTGNYNNVYAGQLVQTNTIDTTGANTGIGIAVAGFNGVNTQGAGSPEAGTFPAATGAAAIFANDATRDSFFGNTGNFNGSFPVATVTLTGMDVNQVYTFDFLASRMNLGATPDNRETQYSVAGATTANVFLNASNNNSQIATTPGVAPAVGGTITITVNAGPNNNNGGAAPTATRFYYLNAMRITSVPEPSAMLFTGMGALLAAGRRRRQR